MLIGDISAMKEALNAGVQTIQEAEQSAKEAKRRAVVSRGDPPAVYNPVANPFGDSASVLTDGFADTSSYRHGLSQATSVPHLSQPTPVASYYEQSAPVPAPAPAAARPQQSGPSDEAMIRLNELKREAESAEVDATSADDYVKALALQFEDIRQEAEKAYNLANEKQNEPKKKKGFLGGGGGKKEQKKDIEFAMQDATQKSDDAHRANYELQAAQEQALTLKEEAEHKRAQADAYEMQLADEVTSVNPPDSMPMSREQFGAAARGQDYEASPYPRSNAPHNPYGENDGNDSAAGTSYTSNPVVQQSNAPAPMGFGGYPGTPARPGVFGDAPMGGGPNEGLMGGASAYATMSNPAPAATYPSRTSDRSVASGNFGAPMQNASSNSGFTDNLMGGTSAYPTDSSIVGGMSYGGSASYASHSVTSEREWKMSGSNVTDHHTAPNASAFPTDSSIAGMSNAGVSYASAFAEMSNAGISYESVPVVADTRVAHGASYPTGSSIAGMSNTGSYVSIPEWGVPEQGGFTTVAPLPLPDNNNPHTGYGTDSSIGGSMSNTGTISGYNSEAQLLAAVAPLPLPDNSNLHIGHRTDSSVGGSISNTGSISGYNSDAQLLAAPHTSSANSQYSTENLPVVGAISNDNQGIGASAAPNTTVDAGGIPSPVQNGANVQSYDYSLGLGANHSISQSKSSEGGIPTPTASNDGYNFADNSSWGGNAEPMSQWEDGGMSQQPVVTEMHNTSANTGYQQQTEPERNSSGGQLGSSEVSMQDNTEKMHTPSLGTEAFGGIPSPDKDGVLQGATLQMGSMSLGVNPTSSLDDGIPTPTGSNDEYSNPFAFQNY